MTPLDSLEQPYADEQPLRAQLEALQQAHKMKSGLLQAIRSELQTLSDSKHRERREEARKCYSGEEQVRQLASKRKIAWRKVGQLKQSVAESESEIAVMQKKIQNRRVELARISAEQEKARICSQCPNDHSALRKRAREQMLSLEQQLQQEADRLRELFRAVKELNRERESAQQRRQELEEQLTAFQQQSYRKGECLAEYQRLEEQLLQELAKGVDQLKKAEEQCLQLEAELKSMSPVIALAEQHSNKLQRQTLVLSSDGNVIKANLRECSLQTQDKLKELGFIQEELLKEEARRAQLVKQEAESRAMLLELETMNTKLNHALQQRLRESEKCHMPR